MQRPPALGEAAFELFEAGLHPVERPMTTKAEMNIADESLPIVSPGSKLSAFLFYRK